MPMYLFFGHGLMSPTLHPGFSDLWRSPPALSSTPALCFFLFFEHSYLRKRRISLMVIGILSMCLRSHTYFTYHQKFYTGRFYLRLSAATICEESSPREIRTLSTISLACWKYFVLSIWPQSFMVDNELRL